MFQQIQQFKLYSSLFQVNIQLHLEYSQITNLILQSFSSTAKCFNDEYQLPIAHSVFKQSVHNVIAHQLRSKSVAKMIELPY